MPLTTHILDTTTGMPGTNITVELLFQESSKTTVIAHTTSDADGRAHLELPTLTSSAHYGLRFHIAEYFALSGRPHLYPWADIWFTLSAPPPERLHIPLILSPYGYTTYRGS